jgi:hypothetical protein
VRANLSHMGPAGQDDRPPIDVRTAGPQPIDDEAAANTTEYVTYTAALAWFDRVIVDQVANMGRHHSHWSTGEQCWPYDEFEDLVGLVLIERAGGGA